MQNNIQPDYIFESSWEVCNMVGGIYTVLSTRAATLTAKLNDKLIFIGPDLWNNAPGPYFEEIEDLFPGWKLFTLAEYNLEIRTGRWKIPGNPVAVLVDFKPLLESKNDVYAKVWETAGVNSIAAYGDYDDSSMFGWASGMVIESYYRFFKLNSNHKVIAHFHEWMTAFGLFYIKASLPQAATIFTTHATSIGRSIAGNHKPLYDYLQEYNGDQMAEELNMVSKHSAEKRAAHMSDCFTTVSGITARECGQLLEKYPDVITPNGFENDFVPAGNLFHKKRTEARNLLLKVAETLTGTAIPNEALLVVTAGRYEYKNKGIDVFIESLKNLKDRCDFTKQVVAFIMVPGWHKGHRTDLELALKSPENKPDYHNKITTHELHDFKNDPVMGALDWFHLRNDAQEKVKVIFVPAYVNHYDGIFKQSYYDLLIGFDLSVFPSYYEPWGYTPLESVAFDIPTITTNLSGFGEWVNDETQHITEGVGIIHRSDYNSYQVANQLAEMICDFSRFTESEVKNIRQKASNIAEKALWRNFIGFYEEAYTFALKQKAD
jgi:glycosyltransferase involved in cell wall biosynthesis